MSAGVSGRSKYPRWLYETSLALYIALMVELFEASKENSVLLAHVGYLPSSVYWMVGHLTHQEPFYPTRGTQFYILWLLLAAIIWIGLRIAERMSYLRFLLESVAGIAIAGAIPCLRLEGYHRLLWNSLSPGVRFAIVLETAIIILWAVAYAYQQRPSFPLWAIGIASHFLLWNGCGRDGHY